MEETDPAAVMVKVAEEEPAAICTEPGTIRAAGRLLASATLAPPPGAAWERVTVQVVDAAALSVVLTHCREETAVVLVVETVIERDRVDAPNVALREAV